MECHWTKLTSHAVPLAIELTTHIDLFKSGALKGVAQIDSEIWEELSLTERFMVLILLWLCGLQITASVTTEPKALEMFRDVFKPWTENVLMREFTPGPSSSFPTGSRIL